MASNWHFPCLFQLIGNVSPLTSSIFDNKEGCVEEYPKLAFLFGSDLATITQEV